MNNAIDNIKLKFNCPANWEDMTNTDGGRHCDSCNKTVYDFTDARPYEFLQILAENNNKICGRFRADQMAPIHLPVWKKWLSAALVLIGINVLSNKAYVQGVPVKAKHVLIDNKKATTDEEIFTGFIAGPKYDKMPEFPGGEQALKKYLAKHLSFKKGQKEGRIYAAFDVAKDGSLINFKIVRSLSPELDNDVIRVLKSSPKWKPAVLKGKAVVYSSFIVPFNFSKT